MTIGLPNFKSSILIAAFLLCAISVKAQNATVSNSASPNANVSTNTSGGTNINQQLNNVYDTSFGFGPGIICRTPQLILNGTAGSTNSVINAFPLNSGNTQSAGSYSGTLGFAIPIGSSVISDCQRYAAQIAKDREISSELSLIRACAQLDKDRIVIDPKKYPNLASCINPGSVRLPTVSQASSTSPNTSTPSALQKNPQYLLRRYNP